MTNLFQSLTLKKFLSIRVEKDRLAADNRYARATQGAASMLRLSATIFV